MPSQALALTVDEDNTSTTGVSPSFSVNGNYVDVLNDTGVDIQYIVNPGDDWLTIPDGTMKRLSGFASSATIAFRRGDADDTGVSLNLEKGYDYSQLS